MKFWIVTPSFNQSDWLCRCIASVQDQAGPPDVAVHHHVQDGGSTDTTAEYLESHRRTIEKQPVPGYTFSYAQEDDDGMYDAINRGWRKAPAEADVIAHINCDEQYLPDALRRIVPCFEHHSKNVVVLADLIVVDGAGTYVCHRRSIKPCRWASRFCCAGFTASTFHSRDVTKEKGVFFDTSWRNIGDKVWYNQLHKAGVQFMVCNELVAIFTDTGANMNWTEEGLHERQRYAKTYQWGWDSGSAIVASVNGLRRYGKECVLSPPASYAIYTDNVQQRTVFPVENPTGAWHKKWPRFETGTSR